MVDASAISVGTVFVQGDDEDQMQITSCNFCILTGSERKIAIIYRELTPIVHAPEICEFLILGSKHPITVFTDH